MAPELALLALLACAFVGWACRLRRPGPLVSRDDEHGLPIELRGARVVHAEETFRSRQRGLVARIDRAHEVAGELMLVEFKTRNQHVARQTDIIELSVQRVCLQEERGVQVSSVAWVVTEVPHSGDRRAHRVNLLDADEVDALRRRYLAIEAGEVREATSAWSSRQCQHCGHRSVCWPGGW